MFSILSPVLDLIFPQRCPFCNAICMEPACLKCKDKIKFITSPLCNICGVPFISEAVMSHKCGSCMKKKRHFAWARGVLVYNDATATAIHRFKYGRDTTYSRPLGSIMAAYPLERFDALIPVPLHVKRLRERGFNQSLLLANAVGKMHGIPVDYLSLKRVRWTEPQVNLSGRDRKTNVRGAFEAHEDVEGKRILLIDDVYTTGATVQECAKVLTKSGAKAVSVLTLARTAGV